MDISIVIVNYNTAGHLKNCLDSLYRYTANINFEVIVVDNNSHNRDIEFFPDLFPLVSFLFRDINDGFGAGCNYGAKNAKGHLLLFVNPDVIFESNLIFDLSQYLLNKPNIAVVSPVYIEEDGSKYFITKGFPGYEWAVAEAFGNIIGRLNSRLFPAKVLIPNEPVEVDWAMGSFLLVKSSIYKAAGGFDETFFLYYEDIDLQYSIKSLGYSIFYHPLFSIKHIKRSSVRSYEGENLFYYHMTRSNIIYMHKHFGFFKRNLIRALHIIGIIIRICSLPFRQCYRGKRNQKLQQYLIKLKLYISGKNYIYRNMYFESKSKAHQNQIIHNDAFWK